MAKGKFYIIVPPDKGACTDCARRDRWCGVRARIEKDFGGTTEFKVLRCPGPGVDYAKAVITRSKKGFSVNLSPGATVRSTFMAHHK